MRKKQNKKKPSFARHSPRRSFLTVSLYGSMRKEEKKNRLPGIAKVLFSNSFSLWYYEMKYYYVFSGSKKLKNSSFLV